MRATPFRPSRQELLQELSLQAVALQRLGHLLLEPNVSPADGEYQPHLHTGGGC